MNMEEKINQSNSKGGLSKRVIVIIAIIILLIAGSVAAYVALNKSTKTKYFLAEKETMEFFEDQVKERFEPELNWLEYSEKNPIETELKISGQYNDPSNSTDYDMFGLEQIINNSSLLLTMGLDKKANKFATDFVVNFAGFEVHDINFYLTDEVAILGLPFLNELLQIKEADLTELVQDFAPEVTVQDIKFKDFFDRQNQLLSEDDMKYFDKEYGQMIYKELSDDAFSSTDEKITVEGESIKAEKITFKINEDELKKLISLVLDKLENDERAHEILESQLALNAMNTQEINMAMNEFKDGLHEINKVINDLHFPDGLTSTIWVDKNLIVQRELSLAVGPNPTEAVTLTVDATQLLMKDKQDFTYNFGLEDNNDHYTAIITGDLSKDKDKIDDTIKLHVNDFELAYIADETLKDGTRTFDRTLSMANFLGQDSALFWSGESAYEKDNMHSTHDLSVEIDDTSQDLFSLLLDFDAKKVKEISIPNDKEVKDIGSMSDEELAEYIQLDATQQFQQWLMGLMGGAGGDLDF